jgi:hypothetical protein
VRSHILTSLSKEQTAIDERLEGYHTVLAVGGE